MGLIRNLIKRGLVQNSNLALIQPKAYDVQSKVLRKLIESASDTAFGKEYGFKELYFSSNPVEDFQIQVPMHTYSDMHPWWQRAYQGELDVCWPGKTQHFALSSGTSEGSSKYIPVTKDMIKAIRKAGVRQILAVAKTKLPKEFLTKHQLMVGGSTDLHYNGISFSGDLSGITTGNLPFWMQPFSKPERRIMKRRSWEEKIEEMVQEAKTWDVGMVAGVPAWIQILFEKIIEHYKLNNIHELWPNLTVYIHGGVAFGPYKKSFEKLLGKEILYFETYLASEGFMAYQTKSTSEGMVLLLNNGIYYEFVPFNKDNFNDEGNLLPDAMALNILEVEPGVDYALLISTCSGAWRYLIGDVVRFTSENSLEIVITGRTKHFLSLCGEHLSVDNMNKAIQLLAEEYSQPFKEFTVTGKPYKGMYAHHWYIACDNIIDNKQFKTDLDNKLKSLNDDYATERNHALHEVIVETLPNQVFIDFLKEKDKVGAQNKFPRVLKGEMATEWESFLQRQREVISS